MKLPTARKRELGQHFLVDENIVALAGRMAELASDDIVLEVGPGLGVLTSLLVDNARFVHAIEIDRGLGPHLEDRFGTRENVKLVFDDALRYPLADLDPPPNKFISNLPYSVATPLVAESLAGLPSVELWCVMVQREVADRFFASPGTKSYSAVSVLVQLTAERTGFHSVSRSVFWPPPNVDSALVSFRRLARWGPELARVQDVVQAAFGHRRKTLVNALALAGFERTGAAAALVAMELPADIRAERLTPADFVKLSELVR